MRVTKFLISALIAIILYFGLASEAECTLVLKVLGVNPSKTMTQKVDLMAYLPKEAKPEDIIDLGDLKVDYDITKALYYVHKEVELPPGESAVRSIEIKDIWVIPEEELTRLNDKAKTLAQKLKGTTYSAEASKIQNDVEQKSKDILARQQAAADALPETHIATYRDNVAILETIKNSVAISEKMFTENQTQAAKVTEKVSVRATWWIILAVIFALAIVSTIFFIIWHNQMDKAKEEREKAILDLEEDKSTDDHR